MSCVECRATFDALDADDQPGQECRVARLDRAHPDCRCQDHSVSPHSVGRVEDDEVVARILVAPYHIDKKTGLPRASALSGAESSGLSLFRDAHAKDDEIRAVAVGLVENARKAQGDKAGVFGVLLMRGSVIRRICREGEAPCYCLYDTGLAYNPSHAEIFQRIADVATPIHLDRRRLLFGAVKDTFVPVKDFRDGLLADLAPRP